MTCIHEKDEDCEECKTLAFSLNEHKVWDCAQCEGNGYLNQHDETVEETLCPCQCHKDAEIQPEPEVEKSAKEILDEMIEAGEAKRVSAKFTPGSTIHKEPCPKCKQVAVEIERYRDGNEDIINLECGHQLRKLTVQVYTPEYYAAFRSGSKGHSPYPFQATGAAFLDKCNGRGLIADEMGLGKTIQALLWLLAHKEAWPFMIVTKASLKINWLREIIEWLKIVNVQIIDSSNEVPINEFFSGFIISVDTLGRAEWLDDIEEHEHIKTIVLDECQTIKNMEAKRTKAVRKLCAGKDHIIGLSGTPIKNNATEYFPVLNILRPAKFYGQQPFCNQWVEIHYDGYAKKYGGIRQDRLDEWNELTGDFIIRRKREEVLPDLPKIQRTFQYHVLGENVRDAYTAAFDDFMGSVENNSPQSWSNTLAAMSRMRHLAGLAKIDPCVEYVEDFLLQNEEEKICIFAHHTSDVIPVLGGRIDQVLLPNGLAETVYITGETPGPMRQEIIDEFKANPKRRVMILSTLAAGEGLNLQFVSHCVMLERQWNPANEEQAEGRFSRIGSVANSIDAKYLVAIDTIDEFFARLVEQKRSFMASTLDGTSYQWDETSLMKELASELAQNGRKPWMMKKEKTKLKIH